MADVKPASSSSSRPNAAASSSSNLSPSDPSNLRNRLARKPSNLSSPGPSPLRRRSSILSYTSFEDASNSFHEDIIHPTASRRSVDGSEDEITHWSSTPLAFAILPAIAGLLFTNGSAFVTDALLLGLAAVFMNWSIRVPREWYMAAQAVLRDVDPIPAALDNDESAIDEEDGSPKPSASPETIEEEQSSEARRTASAQLKQQEILALAATFLFPAVAAYLLHVIRAQLSRKATSLVSDFNLSIFLLAAEFWPARQIVRLISARTWHLQRTVSGGETFSGGSLGGKGNNVSDLAARLEQLEGKLSGQDVLSGSALQASDLANLDTQIQKRLEPRLDSLERAVRRYEKRTTTLAMVTEQRLQNLETRLQDAISLAAVAAQSSQQRKPLAAAAGTVSSLVILPAKIAWALTTWPFKLVDEAFGTLRVLLFGPSPSTKYANKKRARGKPEVLVIDDKLARDKAVRKPIVR